MRRKKALLSSSRLTSKIALFSIKANGPILTESDGEAVFVHLSDFTTDIVYIESQPETFSISGFGKTFCYTPDFLIIRKSGETQYVEIKDQRYLDKPELVERLEKAQAFFHSKYLEFKVYTDSMLRADSELLRNIKHLRRYRSPALRRLLPLRVTLPSPLPRTLGELKSLLGPQICYRLIAEEKLWCDLRAPLNDNTIITLMDGKQHDFIN